MKRIALISVLALGACSSLTPTQQAQVQQAGVTLAGTAIDLGACLVQSLANANGAQYEASGNTTGALVASSASQAAGALCMQPVASQGAPVAAPVIAAPAK